MHRRALDPEIFSMDARVIMCRIIIISFAEMTIIWDFEKHYNSNGLSKCLSRAAVNKINNIAVTTEFSFERSSQ